MNFETLHQKAIECARTFHNAESDLIDVLQQIDEFKVFVRLGYESLFAYATRALKLSEANASNFITVARKAKSVPALKLAIRTGEITVSKARKITPVLNQQNSLHWLELAKTLPKLQLEKEVARVLPKTMTPETARYVTANRLELKLGVDEETMKMFRRAQDLLSQRTRRAASLEDTLAYVLKENLFRNDPVEKAKRVMSVKQNGTSCVEVNNSENVSVDVAEQSGVAAVHETEQIANANASVPGTRDLPAKLKHQVNLRDQGRCDHVDSNGKRCESRRWLEIHHKRELSKGGTNDLENLQTLCYAHHKYRHLWGVRL